MVKIQICARCGRRHFPHKLRCSCGSADFTYSEEELRGRLVTLTKIYVTPKGIPSPLIVGLVSSNGLNLLVRLEEELPLWSEVRVDQVEGGVLVGRKCAT